MAKLAPKKSSSQPKSTSAAAAAAAASAPSLGWPPLSLSPHDRSRCLQICCHAEDLEVSGNFSISNSNNSGIMHLQVQMACLLVLGDVAACRDLWRRHRSDNPNNNNNNNVNYWLEPWWNVAAAMLSNRYTAVWEGLQNLVVLAAAAASTNVPNDSSSGYLPLSIIQTYATEIAQSYRHGLLKNVVMHQQQQQPPPAFLPDYYTTVFGFVQSRELQAYYQQFPIIQQQQQQQRVNAQQQQQHSTTLTCFLEAQRRNL